MPKVVNEGMAGRAVNVLGDRVEFDAAGLAEVTEAQWELVSTLEGYRSAEPADPNLADLKQAEPKPAARRGRPPKEKTEE